MTDEKVIMILESLLAECSTRFTNEEKALKIRNWTVKLSDLTDEQGMEGLNKALDGKMEFMPSVGTFREMCLTETGSTSIEQDATIAWSSVMSGLNSYTSPVFKDSCIAEAIRKMGGWKQLCLMLETEEPFKRKDFIELYTIMRRRKEEYSPMLTGTFEGSYSFIGFDENDDIDQIMKQVENKQNFDRKLLNMISEKCQGK
jgi:hypothetical protein